MTRLTSLLLAAAVVPSGAATLSLSTLVGTSGSDAVTSFSTDSAGNYYFAANNTFPDATITKVSPAGVVLQTTAMSAFGAPVDLRVAVDPQQNIYFFGTASARSCPINATRVVGSVASPGDFLLVGKLTPSGTQLLYLVCVQLDGFARTGDIAVDGSGNAYIAGRTNSSVFPASAVLGTITPGISYGFVTKVDAGGNSFPFSIQFAGGSPSSIALDSSLNVYISGLAGSTLPTVNAIFPTFRGGPSDGFVMKVLASGLQIGFSTFIGGSDKDSAIGLAVTGAGQVVLTGYTLSPNLAPQCTPTGLTTVGFIARLNTAGSAIDFARCLPAGVYQGLSVAMNTPKKMMVAGMTTTSIFVGQYDFLGNLVSSNTFGGSSLDLPAGIALTSSGFAVGGFTASPNFPVTQGPPLTGGTDGFLTIFQ